MLSDDDQITNEYIKMSRWGWYWEKNYMALGFRNSKIFSKSACILFMDARVCVFVCVFINGKIIKNRAWEIHSILEEEILMCLYMHVHIH